jgi:3-deoxy-D-manno-octulosonic-acid transferase
MSWLLNAVYLCVMIALFPWLLYKAITTGKYRHGLRAKATGNIAVDGRPRPNVPVCWFHGVSVGEIHLLRQVVAAFRQRHPDWDCVISTTTDTGLEEARKHFGDLPVFSWPLDFSWAVARALDQVQPSLVVLAEGELWPNFLLAARRRGVPVAVINGRMSPRSSRRYRRLGVLSRLLLKLVDRFAVQTEEYAANLVALGVPAERVHVTGSVKYDGVTTDPRQPRTEALRRLLDVRFGDLVWVAGSTQAPEEQIVLQIYRRLMAQQPNLRLFIVPRQRERFDEVAGILKSSGLPFVRRSSLSDNAENSGLTHPARRVVLVDTIGELGALWGLADLAFVGGSLDGKRGGQNMIEPAACGAAVLFGPHVWNFQETARRLLEADAAIQVDDAAELEQVIRRLLPDRPARQRLGDSARQLVQQQQGATGRTIALLDQLIHSQSVPGQRLVA